MKPIPSLHYEDKKNTLALREDVYVAFRAWLRERGFLCRGCPSMARCMEALQRGDLVRRKGAPPPAWVTFTQLPYKGATIRKDHLQYIAKAVSQLYKCYSHFILDLVTNWELKEKPSQSLSLNGTRTTTRTRKRTRKTLRRDQYSETARSLADPEHDGKFE